MRIAYGLAISFTLLFISTLAYAGAWTQGQGNSLLIVTGNYYVSDSYWNSGGDKTSQPRYRKYELNPYYEYGLKDGITVGANLSLGRLTQETAPMERSFGLGDSEFFLRRRLWQENGFVISAEPMVKLPSPESSHELPVLGSSHPDAGLGLSGGYGFSAYGEQHFINLDTQYRHRFGEPKDQGRINGSVGISLSPQFMILPQVFYTFRMEDEPTNSFTQSSGDDYNLLKLQLSGVYRVTDDLSLQVGGFHHMSGRNVGMGSGGLLSVWKRF